MQSNDGERQRERACAYDCGLAKKMKLQTHHEFDAAKRLVTHSPVPTRLLEFHEEDVQDILALRRVPGVVADLVHDGAAGPPLIVVACVHNLCLRRTQVQHGIAPVRRRVRDTRRVRKGWIQRAVERDTEVSHTHRGSPCRPLDARSSRVHTEACGCAIGQEFSVGAPLDPPPEPGALTVFIREYLCASWTYNLLNVSPKTPMAAASPVGLLPSSLLPEPRS